MGAPRTHVEVPWTRLAPGEVLLPPVEAVLLCGWLCSRCVGFATERDSQVPCQDCGGAGTLPPGATLRVDVVACHAVRHTVPEVWTSARIRDPWGQRLDWHAMAGGQSGAPAWGPLALERAGLLAAIHALEGQESRGEGPDRPGATVRGVRFLAPVTWPEGWARTRRVGALTGIALARAMAKLDLPDLRDDEGWGW